MLGASRLQRTKRGTEAARRTRCLVASAREVVGQVEDIVRCVTGLLGLTLEHANDDGLGGLGKNGSTILLLGQDEGDLLVEVLPEDLVLGPGKGHRHRVVGEQVGGSHRLGQVKGARLGPDGTVMAQNGTVGGVALSDELIRNVGVPRH